MITEEMATAILVVPNQPTQTWWPYVMNMLIDFPFVLPREADTRYLPAHPQTVLPFHSTVRELLTRRGISVEASSIILQSWREDTKKQYRNIFKDDRVSAIQGMSIPFQHLQQLDFLCQHYSTGLSYTAINTAARSSLLTLILIPVGFTFGTHPLVSSPSAIQRHMGCFHCIGLPEKVLPT